jgi:hypothetical protein
VKSWALALARSDELYVYPRSILTQAHRGVVLRRIIDDLQMLKPRLRTIPFGYFSRAFDQ